MKLFPLLALVVVACAPAPAPPPAAPASGVAATPHLREERASTTLDRLAAKDFDAAREWFDAPLRELVSADALRGTWNDAEHALGRYESRNYNGAGRVRGLVRLDYDLSFTEGHATARVTFNEDGTLAGLRIEPVTK